MLIMNQNKSTIINLDNVVEMHSVERDQFIDYVACTTTGEKWCLGTYLNTPEHENQLERIAERNGAISFYRME